MSLEQEIEETKKALEALDGVEAEGEDALEDEVESSDDAAEEENKEEKTEEKEDSKDTKEEEPDASAYARLRREKQAAEKRARELEERLTQNNAEPSIQTDELEELLYEKRKNAAEREFKRLEEDFKKSAPDYDAVVSSYFPDLVKSIRIQNPKISTFEAQEKAKETILIRASEYKRNGFDPILELYEEAKSMGYGKADPVEIEEKAERKRPDLDKVKANRARNAGTAGAKGNGGEAEITLQAAADMSVDEWRKLPLEKRKQILERAQF